MMLKDASFVLSKLRFLKCEPENIISYFFYWRVLQQKQTMSPTV